jgi:WD40 repeat protein
MQDDPTGASIYHTLKGSHIDWVKVIHLLDGQRIITCSLDGTLRLRYLQSGSQILNDWRDRESEVGPGIVNAIALSPDGKCVVSGGYSAVKLWNVDSRKVIATWRVRKDNVMSVCWNPDGGRVVSGSYYGTVRVWDVESGETVLAIDAGLGSLKAVIYSPDETMIATAGEKEFIKTWDAKTGEVVAILKGTCDSHISPLIRSGNA